MSDIVRDMWCRIAAARTKVEEDMRFEHIHTFDATQINIAGMEIHADGTLLFGGVEINEIGGIPKVDVAAALPGMMAEFVYAGPWPPTQEAE